MYTLHSKIMFASHDYM